MVQEPGHDAEHAPAFAVSDVAGLGARSALLLQRRVSAHVGIKHPQSLGAPTRELWAEIWHDIGPRIQHVLDTGEATWDEALLLMLERNGYPEETYHTFSYSPMPDDAGGIGGMLSVVTEETERVISERRLALIRELSSRLAIARTTTTLWARSRPRGRWHRAICRLR